jgi:hypothetical protein
MSTQLSRSRLYGTPGGSDKFSFSLTLLLQLMRLGLAIGALWFAATEYSSASSSKNWPTTTGKILEKRIEVHKSLKAFQSDTLEPKVTYEYTVGGKNYKSDRIQFGGVDSDKAKATIDGFKSDTVTVHYDPKNPGEACLNGHANYTSMGLYVLLAVFMFILMYSDRNK